MTKFGDAERIVKGLLSVNETFTYNNNKYTIIISGKPTCRKGEPKTDIYVLAKNEANDNIEIKISFKKQNADFIENKTNSERAELILGDYWQNTIIDATKSIEGAFNNKKLIYKSSYGRTEEGAMTIGWKFGILNKIIY